MSNPIDGGSRVNNGQPPGVQGGSARGPARREGGDEASGAQAGRSDATSESSRLQAVRESIDSTPEVDQGRVAEVRERIANGEYPLDANRVAERFADFEQLLSDA